MSSKGVVGKLKKERRKPVSRSKRAGLIFPIPRVERFLREGKYAKRLGSMAPVFLSGVMEYLVTEILDLACRAALADNCTRIEERHIIRAVRCDEELNQVLGDVIDTLDGTSSQE